MNFEALSLNCDADNAEEEEAVHTALMIEDIVEHLFGFLTVNEIKVCRKVNRNWKAVGAKMLRKSCHITFDFTKGTTGHNETEDKSAVFSSPCLPYADKSSPFSAFSFFGTLLYPTINTILNNVQESIRELILHGDLKLNFPGGALDLDSLISPYLKKLHIVQRSSASVSNLSFDKILGVKDLLLYNCTLVVGENNTRICPTKLNLKNCKYTKNGVNLELFRVHNYFDLDAAKYIALDGENLSLNLGKFGNDKIVREVCLTKLGSVKWKKCKWFISSLFLDGVSLVDKNRMTIKEIVCTNSTVDITVIQNRTICDAEECIKAFLEMYNPFNSPDVTCVQMNEECVAMLPFCYHMNNLREIEIATEDASLEERARVELTIDHLPVNAKLRVKNYILVMKID